MNTLKSVFVVLCMFCWISTSAFAGDLVVPVPAPNGIDDTAAIQTALNQCVAHGPGCTVQLAAGTYLTEQLFTEDFQGTFKGKGMDVTIIQALPNLKVSRDKPVWKRPPSPRNKYPMLILFFGGDITVSDMTIRVLEPNPLEAWFIEVGQPKTTYMWGILAFMGQSEEMSVVVTRVAVEGKYDESGPEYSAHYNASGLSIDSYPTGDYPPPGYLSGTFSVSASRFDTLVEAMGAGSLSEARLTIGGSPSEANLIQNCANGGIWVDLDSSVLVYSYNDVSVVGPLSFAGFFAFQTAGVPTATPSSFLVQHNRLMATGSYEDGIWIVDLGPPNGQGKTGDFLISDNTITIEPSENGPAYAGIEPVFTDGTVISNNRIVGSGLFGIALEGDAHAMVKGNNVEQVTAEVAPIFLDEGTTDCTVVGFGGETNVLDQGVNNTLVGVNNMTGNAVLPAASDAMKRKMEIIKSMRKP